MSSNNFDTDPDYDIKCPSCANGNIKISKHVHDLPDGDKMLLIKFECNSCSFFKNDVIPLTTNLNPGIFRLRITNEEDLKSKVYRSPLAKLEIPELEMEVEPGPNADFYFTNVEGILFRFKTALKIYMKDLEDRSLDYLKLIKINENLKNAIEGKFPFTLIISDLEGGSYIVPIDNSKLSFVEFQRPNE